MKLKRLLGAASLLFVPCAALAAPAPSETDHQVVVEDPAVAAALQKAIGQQSISEDIARNFGPILYLDKKLTPHESDLILDLLGTTTGTVAITGPHGEHFDVPVLSPGARAFLSLYDPPELNSLWLKDPASMKKFVDVTVLNPHIQPEVVNFFAMNLYVSWRASVGMQNNRYIRETLSAAVNQFRVSGPETERRGKALLYLAMRDVDKAVKEAIPNEIYLNLRPVPPATN